MRIVFAVLAAAGGAGILAYAAFRVFVPMAPPRPTATRCCRPRLAGFVLDAFREGDGAPPVADPELDLLTRRERDVLRLIARGHPYRGNASRLDISVETVETHVSAVLRKLHLSSRYEPTRWAYDRRLI